MSRMDVVTSRKDAEGKTRYTRIGVAFPARDGKDGYSIKLEALPLPNEKGEVWLNMFTPKTLDGDGKPSTQRAGGGASPNLLDDEIPFAPEFR